MISSTYEKTAEEADDGAVWTCVLSFPEFVWETIAEEVICTMSHTVYCKSLTTDAAVIIHIIVCIS